MISHVRHSDFSDGQVPTTKPPRNILLITLVPPYPPTDGHRIHLWNLVRALCAEGWSTTLVSLTNNANTSIPDELLYLCQDVELIHWQPSNYATRDYKRRLAGLFSPKPFHVRRSSQPLLAEAVARRLQQQEFAAVICDEIYTLASLRSAATVPVIVDTQHVAHELLSRYVDRMPSPFERTYVRMEARKMCRWETREARKAFAIGAVSEREADLFRKMCPGARVVPLPNVLDVAQYKPSFQDEQENVVLFSGNMDWFPNQDAAVFFATRVLPELRKLRPQATIRLAGRCQSVGFLRQMENQRGVEVTGFVEDMRREIARAAVCIVPLRIASGTRLKILEAAAMGKAVVSTAIGAEGLDFAPGEEIFIADQHKPFAAAVAELLGDGPRRREMGARARRRVEQNYSLAVLRSSLCATLDPLAQPRSLAARGGVLS